MTIARVARLALLASALTGLSVPHAAARTSIIEEIIPEYVPAETLDGNFLAANIAGSSRNPEAAAVYFREALRSDPRNAELRERAFVAFLANGSFQEAVDVARDIARADRNNGLAQLVLGVDALKKKQYGTARRFFDRGGRGNSADITATLLNAWSWAGSKNFPEAIGTVDRLSGDNVYNVFRDFHAGLIASYLGSVRQGEERLRAAHQAENTTLRVVDAFGRILSRRGKQDEAKAVYQRFEELLPRHPQVRDALAQLNAGRKLTPLVSSPQQGAAEVLYGLGAAGNGQGDEIAALIYLNLALALDPDHAFASMTRGDILSRIGQQESAVSAFNKVPLDSPMRVVADVQIAGALSARERYDDAIAFLEDVLKREPDNIDLLSALGGVQRARKLFPDAAQTYTRAIDLIEKPDTSHWELFFSRGTAYERSKQWPKAEADLKKSLELAGDSIGSNRAHILNYLGYSWVDRNENLEEALGMLKRAAELRPRDGHIVDSLAWAYYRIGRYDDAVKELERAIELQPSESVINDHLGDAYWRVGRRIEAVFQWNHARDLNPEPEDLPKILEKIKNGLPDEDDKEGSLGGKKTDKIIKVENAAGDKSRKSEKTDNGERDQGKPANVNTPPKEPGSSDKVPASASEPKPADEVKPSGDKTPADAPKPENPPKPEKSPAPAD
ncbi:tetratricopeptide repeat protein [Pseudochelatococcus contaminans]|uniref:Tetratricopeptide (TPR) repeat protein n=1 Tax=Pseudochelatococcus contaminans TaxID=1538103 RepID=A0A7W6EHY7_9HYPH|nr:tetratricopeptide repeat protein [Pseudochelatococcus contaminans]MBB3810157.1 tetratricopeptide (TPR) repeat protein [Pseudochelatococcus contaminans]